MPTRPIPAAEARTIRQSVRAGPLAPAFRQLAEEKGTLPSALLRETILAALGYHDTARRDTPRHHAREPNPHSPVLSTALSQEEHALATRLAAGQGLTMNAWLLTLIAAELTAAGIDPPTDTPAPAPEDPARTAALAQLQAVEWAEDPATRNDQIRLLHSTGHLDGLSYADIGNAAGVTRQRVAQVLKPHKEG